jgi:cytochrome b561
MAVLGNQQRYGDAAQVFHWLTLILVIAAYATSPGGPERRVFSASMDFSRQLHETLGMAVFVLVLLRLVWRAVDRTPELPVPRLWVERLARPMHLLLYVLLLTIPFTAVIGSWLEGHPLTLLGLAPIAPYLAQSHTLGETVLTLHTLLGNAILWAAGLHAAAAVFHHFWLRDEVLIAMLPEALPIARPATSATSRRRAP